MGRKKLQAEQTRQYKMYEYYLANPKMSRKEVAEHFGVCVGTLDCMMLNEKRRRGVARSYKRG